MDALKYVKKCRKAVNRTKSDRKSRIFLWGGQVHTASDHLKVIKSVAEKVLVKIADGWAHELVCRGAGTIPSGSDGSVCWFQCAGSLRDHILVWAWRGGAVGHPDTTPLHVSPNPSCLPWLVTKACNTATPSFWSGAWRSELLDVLV